MRRKKALDADRKSIRKMCEKLDVDADRVWEVYHGAVDAGYMQGRETMVLQGAAILVVARQTHVPVTRGEIHAVTGKNEWLISKLAGRITGNNIPRAEYGDFLARGMRKLDMKDLDAINEIAAKVRSDMSPVLKAAIVLYVAACRSDIKITKKNVGEALGINHRTMNSYVRVGGKLRSRALAML